MVLHNDVSNLDRSRGSIEIAQGYVPNNILGSTQAAMQSMMKSGNHTGSHTRLNALQSPRSPAMITKVSKTATGAKIQDDTSI